MSTFAVTIETIKVVPHPNADRLDLAVVGLYRSVIGKDSFKTGDKVLYIPEFSLLPENLVEVLGLTGKLSGTRKNRVKPVRLRNELSQGVVAPLSVLPEGTPLDLEDYSEVLGVTKWEPKIPGFQEGVLLPEAELIPWIEVENLKKTPDIFADGEIVQVTEKIHGTNAGFTVIEPGGVDEHVIVTSKGLGAKRFGLAEDGNNLYWKAFRGNRILEFTQKLSLDYSLIFGSKDENGETEGVAEILKVGVFGEVYGHGIQDLNYGRKAGDPGFAVFDVLITYRDEEGTHEQWLNPDELKVAASEFGVSLVPILFTGPFNLDKVIEFAYGPELVSGSEAHIREGVVVREFVRPEGRSRGAERVIKYVSDDYLTRGGNATEYN